MAPATQAKPARFISPEILRLPLQYLRQACLRSTPQLIYQLDKEGLQVFHPGPTSDACQAGPVVASRLEEAAQRLQVNLRACAVAAVLPASAYLVKTLEIPVATSAQARDILRLEVEAHCPAELGDFEMSYLQLPSQKQAYHRYEVYVARRRVVEEWLVPAWSAGVDWACVVPSVIIWRKLLQGSDDWQAAAGQVGPAGGVEVACLTSRDTLAVRVVNGEPGHHANGDGPVMGCLRSMIMSGHVQPPLRIGWIGNGHALPPGEGDGAQARLSGAAGEGEAALVPLAEPGFLAAAGRVLSAGRHEPWMQTAGIVPERISQARAQRMLRRHLVAAPALVTLAMCVLFAALQVLAYRYAAVSDQMALRIARIAKDGQATQRQAEQLAEVRRARSTQDDLAAVLEALYAATPQGVTYSEVQKDPTGRVRLRGQARSLALPFLLPQELEKTATIEKVAVRAANQASRDSGRATEFSIECQLKQGRPG